MTHADALPEAALLTAARQGDAGAFEHLVTRYRTELYAHCYRMVGSVQDAEDALQDSLLNAWRGLAGFQGRSTLRAWLYRICTNVCLRLIARRPHHRSLDHGPLRQPRDVLGEPVAGPVWLEPWPEQLPASDADDADPAVRQLRRESSELVRTCWSLAATCCGTTCSPTGSSTSCT